MTLWSVHFVFSCRRDWFLPCPLQTLGWKVKGRNEMRRWGRRPVEVPRSSGVWPHIYVTHNVFSLSVRTMYIIPSSRKGTFNNDCPTVSFHTKTSHGTYFVLFSHSFVKGILKSTQILSQKFFILYVRKGDLNIL